MKIDHIVPHFFCSLEVADLLLTVLENPVKYVEDNVEQKVSLQRRIDASFS